MITKIIVMITKNNRNNNKNNRNDSLFKKMSLRSSIITNRKHQR
ncbi:MAG: hypothetical protein K0S41_1526 [Anaerocolumna sp.]|jgi:hypothetical protein|nr:hypothetical protein [Anaerocolumna sp.]